MYTHISTATLYVRNCICTPVTNTVCTQLYMYTPHEALDPTCVRCARERRMQLSYIRIRDTHKAHISVYTSVQNTHIGAHASGTCSCSSLRPQVSSGLCRTVRPHARTRIQLPYISMRDTHIAHAYANTNTVASRRIASVCGRIRSGRCIQRRGHLRRQRLDPLTLYCRLWLKRRTVICYYMRRASIAASNCREPTQGRCLCQCLYLCTKKASKLSSKFKLLRA